MGYGRVGGGEGGEEGGRGKGRWGWMHREQRIREGCRPDQSEKNRKEIKKKEKEKYTELDTKTAINTMK